MGRLRRLGSLARREGLFAYVPPRRFLREELRVRSRADSRGSGAPLGTPYLAGSVREHPVDAVATDEHAELAAPERVVQLKHDLAFLGQGVNRFTRSLPSSKAT